MRPLLNSLGPAPVAGPGLELHLESASSADSLPSGLTDLEVAALLRAVLDQFETALATEPELQARLADVYARVRQCL